MKSSSSLDKTTYKEAVTLHTHPERMARVPNGQPPFPLSFVDLEAQGEGFCGVEHRVSGKLEFSLSSLVTFMKSVVQDHTTQVQIPSFVVHGPW